MGGLATVAAVNSLFGAEAIDTDRSLVYNIAVFDRMTYKSRVRMISAFIGIGVYRAVPMANSSLAIGDCSDLCVSLYMVLEEKKAFRSSVLQPTGRT